MQLKHTKILATLSSTCSIGMINQLYQAGMDVVRINSAHATLKDAALLIKNIQRVSEKIGILIDTKGPEVRVTETNGTITIRKGDEVIIDTKKEFSTKNVINVTYKDFCSDVQKNARVLINDGHLGLRVIKKSHGRLVCKAENTGEFSSRKGVNTPHVNLALPSTTTKDVLFIKLAKKHNVDFIAHSFVRSKKDIMAVRKHLKGSSIHIIAKIENQEGVDNIDDIIEAADGIMVARGDLGIEVDAPHVPVIQKHIIEKCRAKAKPVITATHMLESMISHARPTRAEVSDVANAVFDGTDALMLSGETAVGKYPLQAVKTMAHIALYIERQKAAVQRIHKKEVESTHHFLARQAVYAQRELRTKAIVINTHSGTSARLAAAYRGRNPIYALSPDKTVVRQLNLIYGIRPYYLPMQKNTDKVVSTSVKLLSKKFRFEKKDKLVILGKTPKSKGHSNFLEIATVEQCLKG